MAVAEPAARRLVQAAATLLLLSACAAPTYAPLPVALPVTLPEDVFARCKAIVAASYGSLAVADASTFRIQSDWSYGGDDPPTERRATVFREGDELMVMVELRWLSTPSIGLPQWTTTRGDAAAENQLGEALQTALTADS